MLKQLYKREIITENNPTSPVLFTVLARWGHKEAKTNGMLERPSR